MTFAFEYMREHLGMIALQIVFVLIFAVIFYLYGLSPSLLLYPSLICLFVGCVWAALSFYRAYNKHKRLSKLLLMRGNAIEEALDSGGVKTIDRDYRKMISALCMEIHSSEDKATASYKEMLDYFTIWVHQIKTPIASMRLSLASEDSAMSRKLRSDLLHIEQYVDMVLTYFKTGSDSSDYVFRSVDLDELIRETVRKLRGDFIMKKLRLIFVPSGESAVTDEKWLSFVIEQILSNALKYTNEGSVTISLEKPKTLRISDTGIGIAPEDIPRIFDKGYTGGNGREYKRASGLGMYLCKQICGRLGHSISVESELDKGTTVRIDLSQN